MARSLKKPIVVVRAVAQIAWIKVEEYQEGKSDGAPMARILVSASQDSSRPYGRYWLLAASRGNSLCLFVNPAPSSSDDQLLTGHRALESAYTQVTAAYREAAGDLDDKLAAVERILVSAGILDPAFS